MRIGAFTIFFFQSGQATHQLLIRWVQAVKQSTGRKLESQVIFRARTRRQGQGDPKLGKGQVISLVNKYASSQSTNEKKLLSQSEQEQLGLETGWLSKSVIAIWWGRWCLQQSSWSSRTSPNWESILPTTGITVSSTLFQV